MVVLEFHKNFGALGRQNLILTVAAGVHSSNIGLPAQIQEG